MLASVNRAQRTHSTAIFIYKPQETSQAQSLEVRPPLLSFLILGSPFNDLQFDPPLPQAVEGDDTWRQLFDPKINVFLKDKGCLTFDAASPQNQQRNE